MYPSRSTWSHSSKPRPHRLAAAIVASLLAAVATGPAAATTAAQNPNAATAAFNGMSEAQRVGQLFMVGTPAASVSSQTAPTSRPTTPAT
jgi:hypothetical protein